MSEEFEEVKKSAVKRVRGQGFDAFEVGQTLVHHWGRTITESDAIQFAHLTLAYNPIYFNLEYAKAHGYPGLVVCPHLVLNTVIGMSVEDCSEILGGPFLGVDEVQYHEPVYAGDTITAQSETIGKRNSDSDPDRGVVTWHTKGYNQHGRCVVEYKRSNLAIFSASKLMAEA